jgi:hypothetical protein
MASTTSRSKILNAWRRRALARGAQLEFRQPITLQIAPVSAWDEPTSGYPTEVEVPYTRNIERGAKRTLGRGPQVAIDTPLTLKAPAAVNFQDGAGSAIGDSTASAEGAGGIPLPFSRSIERGAKQTLGRGWRLEISAPATLKAPVTLDTAGAASGDSTVSGALDALADFTGAASGDSTVSGALDALADFAGSAIGDSTASGGLDAFGDFAGAASGDATCDGAIVGTYDYPLSATCHLLTQQGARRKQREIIERTRPTPIMAFVAAADSDGAGSAEGDSTADGTLDAFADFAGSAIGDATASGALDAFADFAGSAIGDSTASGALNALADFAGAASGDSTVSGALDALASLDGAASGDATVDGALTALADTAGSAQGDAIASGDLAALADTAGSAIGDSTASGTLDALADLAGSAIGDAIADAEGTVENNQDTDGSAVGDSTASGGLDALADMAGSAAGDATCEGFIEDATPVVVTPPVVADAGGTGGQVFRGAWTDRIRKPKRKKRLDDLDEMIAELRSRIEEVPVEATAEDIYQRALRVSQALANQPDPSLRAIDNQIVLLQAAINEIDDEEAILLLAA